MPATILLPMEMVSVLIYDINFMISRLRQLSLLYTSIVSVTVIMLRLVIEVSVTFIQVYDIVTSMRFAHISVDGRAVSNDAIGGGRVRPVFSIDNISRLRDFTLLCATLAIPTQTLIPLPSMAPSRFNI